ncbi:glycerate kinase type-2 family protein [Thiolinea disciformis]|uniref:glycerate kinase type-2 family protein n=1 Tax=Thiolinea disciformis TaxID=125614 RepID=UPI00035E08BE|nr:DUF4147 domain-containing protein [Thiolinea disciformis]
MDKRYEAGSDSMVSTAYRQNLLVIYEAGLEVVKGHHAVYQALMKQDLPQVDCHLIAIGKAAESMYQGAKNYLEKGVKSALLISKFGHFSTELLANPRVKAIEADHPVPSASSLQAGSILLEHLKRLPNHEPLLFLVSGGASSLCEVLEDDWSLEQLQGLTQYLLANAYTIQEMNAIRQRISKIKGGKLWQYLGVRSVNCLMISDVVGDDPSVIGSGLLFPPHEDKVPDRLPPAWKNILPAFNPLQTPHDFQWHIVASNALALQAMAAKARNLGFVVRISEDVLQGDAIECAQVCVEQLEQGEPGITLWGGETVVQLPEKAGRGGRNQHFALAAALAMEEGDGLMLLAAGTDGTDGNTPYAGAIVDGSLPEHPQGLYNALMAQDALRRADATSILELNDCLIETGPTGTNVMDVVMGLKV